MNQKYKLFSKYSPDVVEPGATSGTGESIDRVEGVGVMGFWDRLMGKGAAAGDYFGRAQVAFEKDDVNAALTLLSKEVKANPQNVAGHFLTVRCLVKAGRHGEAFQVYSALLMHPHIRGDANLPKSEFDELMVDSLLAWAADIERGGFPEMDLQRFTKAASFYAKSPVYGKRAVDIAGLDEALQRKQQVTEKIADTIRQRARSSPKKGGTLGAL